MVFMRRASRRAIGVPKKSAADLMTPSRQVRDQVTRIRERREEIRRKVGVLSDSADLIREDRERRL
jgi:hypothetical protein